MGSPGFVTLVGTGGLSKTRLATELRGHAAGLLERGAWLVELTGVSAAEEVPAAVARTLDVTGAGSDVTAGLVHEIRERVEKDKEFAQIVSSLSARPVREMTVAFLLALQPEWEPGHYDKTKLRVDRWIDPELGTCCRGSSSAPTSSACSRCRPPTAAGGTCATRWACCSSGRTARRPRRISQPREHFMPKKPRNAKREEKGRAHGQDVLQTRACGRPPRRAGSSLRRCTRRNFSSRRLAPARTSAETWDERWTFYSLRHAKRYEAVTDR